MTARVLYILVHFIAVLCTTTMWDDQNKSIMYNVNTQRWIFLFLSEMEGRPYKVSSWIVLLHYTYWMSWNNHKEVWNVGKSFLKWAPYYFTTKGQWKTQWTEIHQSEQDKQDLLSPLNKLSDRFYDNSWGEWKANLWNFKDKQNDFLVENGGYQIPINSSVQFYFVVI